MLSQESKDEVGFREMHPDDWNFVLDSYLKSWRTCPWAGTLRNDLYYKVQRETLEGLISRGAKVTVSYPLSHPHLILGWICTEVLPDGATVVHYLMVKDAYIALGIGKQLVEKAVPGTRGFYTHRYRQVVDALPGWVHRPEIARRK